MCSILSQPCVAGQIIEKSSQKERILQVSGRAVSKNRENVFGSVEFKKHCDNYD